MVVAEGVGEWTALSSEGEQRKSFQEEEGGNVSLV